MTMMTELSPIPFRIDFYGPQEAIVGITTVFAMDDYEACEQGWDNMPEGAENFQVTQLDEVAE